MDYDRICFVVMPFGKKTVDGREVDFNHIYRSVFEPAIAATPLPEGGFLEPRRSDQDMFTTVITHDMFHYLEYSRMALTDITGLNANVFFELGVRLRAQQSGTAVFRQVDAEIPFDIRQIKAFPYEYEPDEKIAESRSLITQVLTESLKHHRPDSPVRLALAQQQEQAADPRIDKLLLEAENAVRNDDKPVAIMKLRTAVRDGADNAYTRMKLGLLLKERGQWDRALEQFETASARGYGDALREQGIAENKLYEAKWRPIDMPTGEDALRRAIRLEPDDYDAIASLGGILKRQRRYDEALAAYRQATDVSCGHPYPLLNEFKIQGRVDGKVEITGQRRAWLRQAKAARQKQVRDDPPYDAPWSFFDLSEMHLYDGEQDEALKVLREGIEHSGYGWMLATHLESLRLLQSGGVQLAGLDECISLLEAELAT